MCSSCQSVVSAERAPIVYPMKWFKFLIYFSLFAGALMNIMYGINYSNGNVYFIQSNGNISAEQVYKILGDNLRFVNITFGGLLIGAGILCLVTRFLLAKYKRAGVRCLYVLYTVNALFSLLYNIAVAVSIGMAEILTESLSEIIPSLIVGIVFLVANYTYFSKREKLFVK